MQLIEIFSAEAGGEGATEQQVEDFFKILTLMSITFGDLLLRIKELPLPPDDPLRVRVGEAGEALLNYLSVDPWYDDITMKGVINNCKATESVSVSCRNVNNRDIPGNVGQRTIQPFSVKSTWERGDSLIFRNCKLKVKGAGRSTESAGFVSYAAPGGMLNCICGLSSGGSRDHSQNTLFQRLFSKYPMFSYLLHL